MRAESHQAGRFRGGHLVTDPGTAILAGELTEGSALPAIRALARDLRTSIITTTRTHPEPAAEGFIATVPGKNRRHRQARGGAVVLVFKDPAGEPMSVPKQVFLWTWPLLPGAIAWARFGTAWGLLEGIAVYSWWLTVIFGRAGAASWLKHHLITAFVFFVFMFATLFFAFPALLLGTLLSVWWCWALGLSAGVIVTALLWPTQRRFWARLDG